MVYSFSCLFRACRLTSFYFPENELKGNFGVGENGERENANKGEGSLIKTPERKGSRGCPPYLEYCMSEESGYSFNWQAKCV